MLPLRRSALLGRKAVSRGVSPWTHPRVPGTAGVSGAVGLSSGGVVGGPWAGERRLSTSAPAVVPARPLRVMTFNLNGLRAYEKRVGGFSKLMDAYKLDITMLQETKIDAETLSKATSLTSPLHSAGYHSFWGSGRKKGYSGVSTIISKDLTVEHAGPGRDGEGRYMEVQVGSVVFINVYVPQAMFNPRLGAKLQFLADLRNRVNAWRDRGMGVVIAGDFNIAHAPVDVDPMQGSMASGLSGLLDVERDWMTSLLDSGFVDVFRAKNGDARGKYTWWDPRKRNRRSNSGWRLDYVLADAAIAAPAVMACDIAPHVHGSDHCPVVLTMDGSRIPGAPPGSTVPQWGGLDPASPAIISRSPESLLDTLDAVVAAEEKAKGNATARSPGASGAIKDLPEEEMLAKKAQILGLRNAVRGADLTPISATHMAHLTAANLLAEDQKSSLGGSKGQAGSGGTSVADLVEAASEVPKVGGLNGTFLFGPEASFHLRGDGALTTYKAPLESQI